MFFVFAEKLRACHFDTPLNHREESYHFFFSRCDKTLPAMLFVRLLERPSRNAFDASFATFSEVTFLAISIKV